MPVIVTPTREDLERLEENAWQLYGDMATLNDATVEDRRKAFDAAVSATLMSLEYDRAERQGLPRR